MHILYRFCNKENQKLRPSWYSKPACLGTLVDAMQHLERCSLTILCDGEVPSEIRCWLSSRNDLVTLYKSGNAESFLQAISIAATFRDDDIVYFVEDDYVHTSDSLTKLRDAFDDCPGDYFTLYDHPDRYLPSAHPRHDTALHVTATYLSRSHHWRTIESTCMTFAAKVRTLQKDLGIFMMYVRPGQMPRDRLLFRHLQGLAQFAASGSRRILLGPVPSLATHCEQARLAPHVNWRALCEHSKSVLTRR